MNSMAETIHCEAMGIDADELREMAAILQRHKLEEIANKLAPRHGLSPRAARIYTLIGMTAGRTPAPFSQSKLAAGAYMPTSCVPEALNELVRSGKIEVRYTPKPYANRYAIK